MKKISSLRTLALASACFILSSPCFADNANPDSSSPTASSETRAIGPFNYNVSKSGPSRLLPDISLMGSFAGAIFSEEPTEDVGHDPSRTGFNLQEIELALQSTVDTYLKGDVFLSFHEEGVELEEAYVTTLALPKGLQLRAGKFLIPFGRQNQKHLHAWEFVDNTLVNRALIGPEGLGEIGLEASYLFPTPFFLQLQTSVSNGDNDTSFNSENNKDLLYQGRLAASVEATSNTTLLWGASGAFGKNSLDPDSSTTLLGGDFLFKWKPNDRTGFAWQTEYLFRRLDGLPLVMQDGGLYSFVDYLFLKRFHLGLRADVVGFPVDTLNRTRRGTAAFTFDPTEFSRLRLQYALEKPDDRDTIHAAFLQLQFNMGAHGGHAF